MSTADKAPATKKGALVISEVESVVEVSPVFAGGAAHAWC